MLPNISPFRRRSVARQLADHLREEIQSGQLSEMLPGEHAFAEALGVSRPILRRALTVLVKEGWLEKHSGARTRVVRSVQKLPQERPPVLFLWGGRGRPDFQAAVELAAAEKDIPFVSRHLGERGERQFRAACREYPASPMVMVGTTRAMQQLCVDLQRRVLVLGSVPMDLDLPYLDFDYAAIGHHAAALFHRMGHRHVALLTGEPIRAGDQLTLEAFRTAWREPDTLRVFRQVESFFETPNTVSGVFCFRPELAVQTLCRLQRRGIAIPQQMSILSRDFHPVFSWMTPVISSYATDRPRLIRAAIRAIRRLWTAEEEQLPHRHLLVELSAEGRSFAAVDQGRSSEKPGARGCPSTLAAGKCARRSRASPRASK